MFSFKKDTPIPFLVLLPGVAKSAKPNIFRVVRWECKD